MVMNLYILFLVSLPEAFLNLIIFLLFAGAKNYLTINRANVIRFAVTLVVMLTATYIIRPHIPNIAIISIFAHSFIYIVLITLVYRLKVIHALLSVIFTALLYSMIENLSVPFIITYISKGIEDFTKNYQLFPLYSIPTRIFQVLAVLYLWKYEILLVTRISRQFHKTFIFSSLILVVIEYYFGYVFYSIFNTISLVQQIIFAIALILLVVAFNFLIFKAIYITIGKIITNGFSQYKELEDNAKLAFDAINNLIKNNRTSEAIEIIEGLKIHD